MAEPRKALLTDSVSALCLGKTPIFPRSQSMMFVKSFMVPFFHQGASNVWNITATVHSFQTSNNLIPWFDHIVSYSLFSVAKLLTIVDLHATAAETFTIPLSHVSYPLSEGLDPVHIKHTL
jgi:hypothetical protein